MLLHQHRTVVLRPEAGGALATTLAADPDRARAALDAALANPKELEPEASALVLA